MMSSEKRYANIIDKERPMHEGDAFSRKHPPMPLDKRAKIFQPFDALRGFSAEVDIAQGNLLLVERKDLDAGELDRINAVLLEMNGRYAAGEGIWVSVTHFYPRKMREDAVLLGTYETVEGRLSKMDAKEKFLIADDKRIDFEDISVLSIM
ncbi:MAG: hypothetical protein IJT32_06140 [Lachnospiraceae bacterium]|nr:hypothetical protein [Lachnospiraceae bacterium]